MAEIEIDVDYHEVMALDNNMRHPWPTEGMPCEVSECSDYIYSTYNSYIKHWKKYHTDTTVEKHAPNVHKNLEQTTNYVDSYQAFIPLKPIKLIHNSEKQNQNK